MSPATYVKEDQQSKVHFSEYLKTANQSDEAEKPAEDTKPEPQEAK